MGSIGQGAYSAAKAGIAGLTLVQAAELGRYGVTANGIAPVGPHPDDRGGVRRHDGEADRRRFDAMAPDNVSPLVAWLGSAESRGGDRSGVRGRGRQGVDRRRLAPRPRHRQRRHDGSRPTSARPSASSSPTPPTPPRSTAPDRLRLRSAERADRQHQEEDDERRRADVEDDQPLAHGDAAPVVPQQPDAEGGRREEHEQPAQDAEVSGAGDDHEDRDEDDGEGTDHPQALERLADRARRRVVATTAPPRLAVGGLGPRLARAGHGLGRTGTAEPDRPPRPSIDATRGAR